MGENEIIYDNETEQAVIGAMMEDEKVIPTVLRILNKNPQTFYSKAHQIIFEAILKVYDEDNTSDAMLVAKEIKRKQQEGRIGGLPYLYDLLSRVVDTVNIEYYCEIVRENYIRRQIESASARFKTIARDQQKDLEELVDELEQIVTDISGVNTQDIFFLPEIMNDRLESLMERKELKEKGELREMSCGFYELDENQTASELQTTFVIGGSPGAGKSSLMRNIAYQRFIEGCKGLLFTTEMSKESVADCFYASLAEVPIDGIKKLSLREEQWDRVREVRYEVQDIVGWVDDHGRPSLPYIKSQARDKKNREGLDFLVVDYLQHCAIEGYGNKADALEDFAYALDGLAHELDIHVIIVSQLNREARKQSQAVSWGYKSSGGIEEACTCAMQLKRTLIHPKNGKGSDVSVKEMISCSITKDKFGATNIFPLVFEKPTLQFRDADIDELELFNSIYA